MCSVVHVYVLQGTTRLWQGNLLHYLAAWFCASALPHSGLIACTSLERLRSSPLEARAPNHTSERSTLHPAGRHAVLAVTVFPKAVSLCT